MSILSWLKQMGSDSNKAELIDTQSMTFAANEQQFHGLDMKSALDAHLAWTHRLEEQMNGTAAETLEVGTVASDCNCMLGKWIHGEGKQRFGQMQEYTDLKKIHAEFHLTAGEILHEIQSKPGDTSISLKPIKHKSGSVQLALVRLYASAQ
jgi:hypothetical protein